MTAKKQSLLEKGVLKKDSQESSQLVHPNNVNFNKLEEYVCEVARHLNLPHQDFVVDYKQRKDVQIFDFSSKQESHTNFLLKDQNNSLLLVALVGDALVNPAWPQGTGANRAVLFALDTAWMIKELFENWEMKHNPTLIKKLQTQWHSNYRLAIQASPNDLTENFANHGLNPSTRYKKNTLTHFH